MEGVTKTATWQKHCQPLQNRAATSGEAQNTNLEKISAILTQASHGSLTDDQCVEAKQLCINHLKANNPVDEELRLNEILELALDFHLNGNQAATTIIGRCVRNVLPRPLTPFEVTYYRLIELRLPPEIRNKHEFVASLKEGADSGRKVAQFALGKMYLEGSMVRQDTDKAFDYIQQSAAQGYQLAIDTLETLPKPPYRRAQECEQTNPDKALALYKQAASEGNVNAMFRLGELSLQAKNTLNAITYFEMAEKAQHSKAPFQLAEIFATQYKECKFKSLNSKLLSNALKYYSKSTEKTAAFKSLKLRTETGDKRAQSELRELYLSSTPTPHPEVGATPQAQNAPMKGSLEVFFDEL